MTGHGRSRRILQLVLAVPNMPSCLEQIKRFMLLTNWQVQWAFPPWQGLERYTCTVTTESYRMSLVHWHSQRRKQGLGWLSRDRYTSVLYSGWVAGDRERSISVTGMCHASSFTACLGAAFEATTMPSYFSSFQNHPQTSPANSLSYKPLGCHLLKIHSGKQLMQLTSMAGFTYFIVEILRLR